MSLSLKLSKSDTGAKSTRKNNMPKDFRKYINERLKDKTFRKEYEAIERNEDRKTAMKRTIQDKLHSSRKRFSGHARNIHDCSLRA